MALDWTNFTPNRIPKSTTSKENLNTSVPPDAEVSGDPTEITTGPKKVFKRGYPTGQSVEFGAHEGSDSVGGKGMSSGKTDLLTLHGVTDGSQICQVLHPKGMSLLQSIASQKAFLVTKDFKVIDVAAYEWPINLETAKDVRTVLKATIRHGEEVGVVAGVSDDYVMIRVKAGDLLVSVHDLEPVMADEMVSEPLDSPAETNHGEPKFEYKGYKYIPDVDHEYPGAGRNQGTGVDKIWHSVVLPNGTIIEVDFTPYQYMTQENFEAWIDNGVPPRNGVAPLQPEDLKKEGVVAKAAETPPQEDVQGVFDAMAPEGTIRVVKELRDFGYVFIGETTEDQRILENIIGDTVFVEEDYDRILDEVGKAGYSLEQDIVEE